MMIFRAATIDNILQVMKEKGITLQVEWVHHWSIRHANRVWIAHNGHRIELNRDSDWLDHLAYEITRHPEVKLNPDWYTYSYCHQDHYTVPEWVENQTGWR